MKIDVRQLKKYGEGGLSFAGELPQEAGLFEGAVSGPVTYSGTAVCGDGCVILTGAAEASLQSACDRCGKPLEFRLKADLSGRFFPEGGAACEDDDTYGAEGIDLDAFVRERIVLALPMRRLCSQDCKGLCPVCGKDLNTGACGCDFSEREDNPFAVLKGVVENRKKRK